MTGPRLIRFPEVAARIGINENNAQILSRYDIRFPPVIKKERKARFYRAVDIERYARTRKIKH